jgi:hypothetical protein
LSAVVVVEGGERIRSVLVDVYAELGLAWSPSTAGSISAGGSDVRVSSVSSAVRAALTAAGEVKEGALVAGSLALAEELLRAG